MNTKTIYYLIWNRVVGKEEGIDYYIFKNNRWEPDTEYLIMDRLFGYDASEPAGSPYGFANESIMSETKVISYKKAMKLTGGIE